MGNMREDVGFRVGVGVNRWEEAVSLTVLTHPHTDALTLAQHMPHIESLYHHTQNRSTHQHPPDGRTVLRH